jgi:D-alanyl-D-alanine carboxypeptidase
MDLAWDGGNARVTNINSFLWRYSGAIGLKTGYTGNAGYSVSAAAKRGSHSLVVVLLGCPSNEARWTDAARIMDYGFKYYTALTAAASAQKKVYVVKTGDTLYGIAARLGKRISDIMKLNNAVAQHPNRLTPGQTLVIP